MQFKRYLYNSESVANKLHHDYRNQWIEMFNKRLDTFYKQEFDQLCALNPNTDRKQMRLAIPKLVRVLDPNMLKCKFNADESHGIILTYRQIQETIKLPKKVYKLIMGLTISGEMIKTLQYAKDNPKLTNPQEPFSTYIEKYTRPTSPYFHLTFTKDLEKICHPNWLVHKLKSKEECQEMLTYWLQRHKGKVPTMRDTWVVPKGHALEIYTKLGFKILPVPGTVWQKLDTTTQFITMMLTDIKKGIKPAQWHTFKYHHSEQAEKLEQQYPEILIKSKWLKENLTPSQQEKVDKWNKVADLVLNDVDDYTLMKNMNTEDRSLVGNHLKMLDKKMRFDSMKVKNLIFPIIDKIKTQRPILYKLYCHTKLDTKANILDDWLRDIEARRTQDEYIAMKDKSWEDLTQEQRYQISAFVRKGSRYPDFAKKIKKLRPDWFDAKRRKQIIRMRFHAKEKVAI